jgi:hypothetical protein
MIPVPRTLRGFLLTSLIVSGLAVTGCEPSAATSPNNKKVVLAPKGRIVRDGAPLKVPTGRALPPGDSGFRVTFIRLGPTDAGKQISANVLGDEPGGFELLGQDGKPIPPGRYRVAVVVGPEGGRDQLGGKYGPDNSPIEVEVKEGEDLVIDLAKYP